MIDGLAEATTKGTPQGGPFSPLLSNLLLDDMDRGLESRGLRFAVTPTTVTFTSNSKRAGERVLQSVTRSSATKLRLQVDSPESVVERPWKQKFLGFTFTTRRKRSIAPASRVKFEKRIRELDQA